MSGNDTRVGVGERSGAPASAGAESARLAVEHEHSQLDEQLRQCRASLADGQVQPSSLELALELSESIEAHFGREESLYYPTLSTLLPEIANPLQRIVETHADFRSRLTAIVRDIQAGEGERADQALADFATRFRAHEQVEESLLGSIAEGATPSS
jgi:hypothetical protein